MGRWMMDGWMGGWNQWLLRCNCEINATASPAVGHEDPRKDLSSWISEWDDGNSQKNKYKWPKTYEEDF